MCNNTKWIEIDSVENALKWFEKDKRFESKYRRTIEGKGLFDKFTDEEIKTSKEKWNLTPEEYYSGLNDFDPDSSPKAWEHYRRHYSIDTFGIATDNSEYRFSFLGWTKNQDKENIKEYCYRLCAVSSNMCKEKRKKQVDPLPSKRGPKQKQKGVFRADDCERLGGDTDFNFNSTVYKYNEKLNTDEDGERLLKNCTIMHHSLLNFSLIQAIGNMQRIKKPSDLDRADCLICKLSSFFPIKQPQNIKENYLSNFDNIYDYCSKIYFLPTEGYPTGMMILKEVNTVSREWNELLKNNKKLIDALIETGDQHFRKTGSNDDKEYNYKLAINYMLTAVRFWQAKERYFELIDPIIDSNETK